jgi:hypothetical protein
MILLLPLDRRMHMLVTLACTAFITILFPTSASAAPINLNIKSSLLSRFLKDDDSSGNSTAPSKSRVGLDLSGDYECLLWGRSTQDDGRIPLIQIEGAPLALAVGVHYNFAKAWYGASKLTTKLQWKNCLSGRSENLFPSVLDFSADLSVNPPVNHAGKIGMRWKNDESVSIRLDQSGSALLEIQAPVHKRLLLVSKSNFNRFDGTSSLGHFNTRIPIRKDWLPDIKLGTSGILSSRNEIGVGRVGLRLMWSRSLGIFGFDNGYERETRIHLEVSTIDRLGQLCTSLKVETTMEEPKESLHVTFIHESIRSG